MFLCFADEDGDARRCAAYMGDWFDHHAGFGRDMSTLRRAARLTYDVGANWKIVAENYSECYHCPPVHPLLNRLTPYDLGEDFLADGPVEGRLDAVRRGLRDDVDERQARRPAAALRPRRDRGAADLLLHPVAEPDRLGPPRLRPHPPGLARRPEPEHRPLRPLRRGGPGSATIDVSGAVEFWDITNREDYHVVEMQQQGTRSRSWVAGRYSNQEASVHAFDIMVADRYANDGIAHDPRLAHGDGERPALETWVARRPGGGPERHGPGRPRPAATRGHGESGDRASRTSNGRRPMRRPARG